MSTLKDESIRLPATLKGGLAYQLPIQSMGTMLIAADVVKILDASLHAHFGIEYELKKLIAIRFGYLTGYDERSIQGGTQPESRGQTHPNVYRTLRAPEKASSGRRMGWCLEDDIEVRL